MRIVEACLVTALMLAIALPADAEPLKCQRSILKEATKLARTRMKELQKCEDQKLKGTLPGATDCAAEPKIAKAETKLRARLEKSCGGADRTCGTADDEPLPGIGWPAACPDFQELGCTNAIAGCDDIAECLVCVDRAAVEQASGFYFDGITPAPESDVLKCQRTIGGEMRRLFEARANALRKCWDTRYKGGHANDCPSPGDGKAEAKIAKATSKARTKICKACGGADRECGGGDDLTPVEIDFPLFCPNVDACTGLVTTLDTLVDCATCVTSFDADCTNANAVPALTGYPATCTLQSVPSPQLLHLDGTTGPLDLDLGSSGFAHNQPPPWIGRLTLAMTDCAGDGNPTFGECTLSGPVHDNDPTHRCADQPWVECQTDASCLAAGAAGPCRFFLGPPQPTTGLGNPFGFAGLGCVVTEFSGPVTGTIDVEAGNLEASMPVLLRIHRHVGLELGDPCPRCIASTCDAGPRQGMACTVHGTSTVFADQVSLDCPPDPDKLLDLPLRLTLPLATRVQQATLTTASPLCTAAGFTNQRCFCDTCATAAAEPCFTDADCPGGASGSCGGLRCSTGGSVGATCMMGGSVTDPACNAHCTGAGVPDACCTGAGTGFFCSACTIRGEPTAPNPCRSGMCTAGVCAEPSDGHCGPTETFRFCLAHSDCPFAGDTCSSVDRPCFDGSGDVGQSVVATGTADPPINSVLNPVLAGLFCVPPTINAGLNTIRGTPGLGRVTASVTAMIE